MSAFNSPFSEHIRTNYVPSPREKDHISELLIAPQDTVCVLDTEIAELQKKFDEIKAKRDGLDNVIAEHKRLLSPFRRIHDDILKMIFVDCLPTGRNVPMTMYEAPLILGRVSRRWRHVSFDTPYLWSSLHIGHILSPPLHPPPEGEITPPEHSITPQLQSHLHAILQWLSRSGTRPLSISMHPSVGNVNFRLYLQILLSFSYRWFSFELTSTHESAILDLASSPSEAFPALEVLHLTFPTWTGDVPQLHEKIQSGILSAKNLRSITIHYFPLNLATMEIDWSSLTSLILCDPSSAARRSTPDEAYWILSHCKNLVYLTIAIYDPSPSGVWLPSSSLYLPHLETFSVNDHFYSLATIFDSIDAPSLNRVSYSTQFWPSILRRSPLVALLSRNGQSVRSLTIDPRYMTHADVIECFKTTPFLSKIVCKASRLNVSPTQRNRQRETPIMSNIMKAIFQLLIPANHGQSYWPRIQSIECAILGLSDQDVLNFIQKRMTVALLESTLEILPLTDVKISFGRPKQMDLVSILEEYTKYGLRLDFRDYWEYYTEPVASPGIFDPRAGIKTQDNIVTPF